MDFTENTSRHLKHVDELSANTKRSRETHIRLFNYNNIPIDKENLVFKMKETLDKMRTMKNKPLSNRYKCALIVTIKQLFPESNISTKGYRETKENRASEPSSEIINMGIDIINHSANTLASNIQITNIAIYDTLTAILLVTFTGLRISEVYNLKLNMFDDIRNERKVQIKTKTNDTGIVIPYTQHLETLMTIIENRYDYYNTQALTFRDKVRDKRSQSKYVIRSAESGLYPHLKEIIAQFEPGIKVTFNTFRKCTTSALLNNNFIEAAMTINRHTTPQTSAEHYGVVQDNMITENIF